MLAESQWDIKLTYLRYSDHCYIVLPLAKLVRLHPGYNENSDAESGSDSDADSDDKEMDAHAYNPPKEQPFWKRMFSPRSKMETEPPMSAARHKTSHEKTFPVTSGVGGGISIQSNSPINDGSD